METQQIVEIGAAIFGVIQLIARALPTKEHTLIENPIMKTLSFLFSATNTK